MKTASFLKLAVALALASAAGPLSAHDHMPCGATSNAPGAMLEYVPSAADYTTNSGLVFNLAAGTNAPYLGYYYTADQVFTALAATLNNGGPDPGCAALGVYVQVKLLSVRGPAGASFGFWETTTDGVDATNLTWSVPVPFYNGTNLIHVSESDGSPGSDPYGHLHGRIYSVTKPGFYVATWQFVDTSTNGSNGGPVDLPAAPFSTYYQAGLTIASIGVDTNGVEVTFACPSLQPDDLSTPPANYTLLTSPTLGPNAMWQPVGSVIVGDDTLHTVTVPQTNSAAFFRLSAQYFN
jgi:hypothetical protein